MKREICKKMRKLIDVYYQNLLEAGPASEVEAHLSECPSCRKAYEETREVLTLLKKDRPAGPGAGLLEWPEFPDYDPSPSLPAGREGSPLVQKGLDKSFRVAGLCLGHSLDPDAVDSCGYL